MEESDAILRLVDKIERGLPEIKTRSISALHSKVTLGLVNLDDLPKAKRLPGVLLTWINDNNTRSELLFKVLTILSYICKSTEGLVLLEQYEATQFFKELRVFLLGQQPKSDYTNLLQLMIKSLLPLHPQTAQLDGVKEKIQIQPAEQPNDKNSNKTAKVVTATVHQKTDLSLTWTVSRETLSKKQEDDLYALMMELRHGKRELQLQWLKRIHQLVRYWGYKWFRFRPQLVAELTEQFQKSKLKWLIVDILRAIVRGIDDNASQFSKGELDLVNVSTTKIGRPEKQEITLSFKASLFQSIYSSGLIDDLIAISQSSKDKMAVWQWLLYFPYKFTPKFFITAFRTILLGNKMPIGLSILNRQLQYYCSNFSSVHREISGLIASASADWELDSGMFPVLMGYLRQMEQDSSFKYISKYGEEWSLGSNLHNIVEIMGNLQKGIDGISASQKSNYFVSVYIDCLLILGIAVDKQDPLMKHYPQIKDFIVRLSDKVELAEVFYQQILTAVNSHGHIKYGSKQFIRGQVATMVLSQADLFDKIFSQAFCDKKSLSNWIEVVRRLVVAGHFSAIDRYAIIFYCLSYHKETGIRDMSKLLMQKMGKNGKTKIMLCKIFSKSQEERNRVCAQIFGDLSQLIQVQLVSSPEKVKLSRKALKISQQTIDNYSKIIFNKSLQEQVRLSGAQQLLQTLERIELNEEITGQLIQVSKYIFALLRKYESSSLLFLASLVQLNSILNNILPVENRLFLKLEEALQILSVVHSPRIIQIMLQKIYCECFQNSFSSRREAHFTTLMYPHISYITLDVSQQNQKKNQSAVISKLTRQSQLQFPDYRQTQSLQHFLEWSLFQLINSREITLDDVFVSIIEKQIGEIIHAGKSYASLHYLEYVFTVLTKHNIALPQKITDFSSPLLNNILSKDQSSLNSTPVASILAIIGCKRVKQLQSMLLNSPPGYWKYILMGKMQNLQAVLLQGIIKGLLGINYGREATQILRLVIVHGRNIELNQFSQSILLSSALKFIRQDADQLLRETAFCFLIQFYGCPNLQCEGVDDLFSSIASLLLDQPLPAKILILAVHLVRIMLSTNSETFNQGNILKIVVTKLSSLLTIHVSNQLIAASVYEVINTVIFNKKQELLGGLDIVDLAMTVISNMLQKKEMGIEKSRIILTSVFNFLYLWSDVEKDLSKYLLTSTRIIASMLTALEMGRQDAGLREFYESVSRLWLQLSSMEEDLFVYKLNQAINNSTKSLFSIICAGIEIGGIEYFKMVGWTLIIWTKDRDQIDGTLGEAIARAILGSSDCYLIKWILPFSIEAKRLFLASALLQGQLKQCMLKVENRMIRDTKQKKKKSRAVSLQQKQQKKLIDFFSLLSALFYWGESSEMQLQGGESVKRILLFLEKFYCAGQWQERVTKSYLKTMTNLALSVPFANCCGSRLSENSVMVEQLIGSVSKSQLFDGAVKISMRIIGVLIHIEAVRSMILRARVIEQLFSRLCKSEQRGDLSLQYAMEVIDLFLSLSRYKEANVKLLTDKKMLQILLRLLKLRKFSLMEEKIVNLLGNLACFRHNKTVFMSNREIHKVILGLLEDESVSYRQQLLNLLYNIVYKNSAALKLYRRAEVVEVIRKAAGGKQGEGTRFLLQALESEQA